MPRTRSLAWKELKLGVMTIAAISVAAATIFLVMGGKGFWWQRYTLKALFPNVQGLNVGSPVRVAGKEVGSVVGVDFAGDQVEVVFEVNRTVQARITDQSRATIGSVSLLGEGAVDITMATRGTPVPAWGYVATGRQAAALSDVTTQASEGIAELTGLIKDVRDGRGSLGKFMTDQDLYNQLDQFIATAADVAKTIRDGKGSMGRFVNDPKIAMSLEGSLRNLEDMTHRINAGNGSIGKLVNDETFARSLSGATTNLQTLTERLNRGEGSAGKFITDPALFNQLTSLADRLDKLTKGLNEGEGSLGQVLKDKRLYENMNAAVTDVRDLVAAIKKDPKKYLNVRVSIF
jgi:phospholipid/cholesterol/gamma-HCH transport system substrate-binding protein